MKTVFIAAIAFAVAVQVGIPQDSATKVSGSLKSGEHSDPIPNATIILRREDVTSDLSLTLARTRGGLAPQDRKGITDENGRFSVINVPAGEYSIVIQDTPYLLPKKGAGPLKFTVTAGRDIKDLDFQLLRASSISGALRDLNRQPVGNANVQLFGMAYRNGRRLLAQMPNSVRTNDRGEYKFTGIVPGEFYLRAQIIPPVSIGGPTARTASTTNATSYYPGTPEAFGATPITIREGEDSEGRDFTISTERQDIGTTISGILITDGAGLKDGMPLTGFGLVPRDVNKFYANFYNAYSNVANAPGKFEIRGVPPGQYDMFVVVPPNGFTARSNGSLYGRTPVTVGKADIADVQMVLRPNVDIGGKIEIKGDPARVRLAQLKIEFTVDYAAAPLVATPNENGSFGLVQASPYFYRLGVSGLPTGAYVEDILQKGHSIYDSGLDASQDPSDLQVVLNTNGGKIQGTVVETAGTKNVAEATVGLVPTLARRENLGLYKAVITAKDGTFTMLGIAPGEYKLFAWEDIPEFAYENAEFLSYYESRGQPITVSAGGSFNVQMKASSLIVR